MVGLMNLNVLRTNSVPGMRRGRIASSGDVEEVRHARDSESGRMKFMVRRYDSVPNGDDVFPPDQLGNSGLPIDHGDVGDGLDSTSSTTTDGGRNNRSDVAHRGRIFARRHKRRLVFKDGECNISLSNVHKRKRRYLGDLFTTMLDMKWRYNLLMFSLAFLMSWLIFGFLWWLIAKLHGDLSVHYDEDSTRTPCVNHVHDFVTALLFSVETQHTIGYGVRVVEPTCPPAVILVMVQSCVGVFIQSMMTGIIFAKLSRPKGRAHTIMFSKVAVICQRDGQYCLLFRVADMRKSHIVAVTVRATMVRNRITKEGEVLPLCQLPLEVQPENSNSDGPLFLVWPVTIIHKIDKSSPFWETSAEQLLTDRFEIVIFLEGTVESTGMTTQVRTSFLPGEIMWGHRLAPLLTYQKENGQYKIDYTAFHTTTPVVTPECSAKAFSGGDRSGEERDGGSRSNLVDNYHTETTGLRRAPTQFKHRMLRRNTEIVKSFTPIPEERTVLPALSVPKQKAHTKLMNGLAKFLSPAEPDNVTPTIIEEEPVQEKF